MFKMLYTDTRISTTPMEVVVYDFLHVSPEQSYALCWNTKTNYWITVPISMLVPIEKKGLNG